VKTWYVDTSVLLGVVTGRSAAARRWFDAADIAGDHFVASLLVEVEARHQVHNIGSDPETLSEYLDDFTLLSVDDDLMAQAISVPGVVGGADSIHIASAERIRGANPTLVTHDRQMATAAKTLAFDVRDPVTDDPHGPAVAPAP
jgi:predicted nucleic acid-binding protein